jgi:hypothetical protein
MEGIYTEATHDHYDAKMLSKSDKEDWKLEESKPDKKQKEIQEAITLEEDFTGGLDRVLDDEMPDWIDGWWAELKNNQVKVLAKWALDDEVREFALKEAVNRNLAPSGEEASELC